MALFETFFKDLDHALSDAETPRIRLRIIGSSALMLQTAYERGTKDSDVLETASLTPAIKERLLAVAGERSTLYHKHRVYLDIVSSGLPFLPAVPTCHSLVRLNETLQRTEIEVLDVVDVIVSKLKRFAPNDMSDIRAMADQGRIDHATLVRRFRSAVDAFSNDARAEDIPRYIRNLHRVERDYLLVEESTIDVPDWV